MTRVKNKVITVKITETITSTKFAPENSFSQQNVDPQNSKQKRLCCQAVRVCDWFTDFSLISDTNTMHLPSIFAEV
jgi:hypothetical protein